MLQVLEPTLNIIERIKMEDPEAHSQVLSPICQHRTVPETVTPSKSIMSLKPLKGICFNRFRFVYELDLTVIIIFLCCFRHV